MHREREKERKKVNTGECLVVFGAGGPPGRLTDLCLSIRAILFGIGSGLHGVWVRWLLAVLSGWHPLVHPVQAPCLLKVSDLPRGRETLNSCQKIRKGGRGPGREGERVRGRRGAEKRERETGKG